MFKLLHAAFLIILVIILITQIICPMFGIFSNQFFWFFRKKEKKIEKLKEDMREIQVERELKETEKARDKMRKSVDEEYAAEEDKIKCPNCGTELDNKEGTVCPTCNYKVGKK